MTGNKFYLSYYQDIDGGFVAFGGSSKGDFKLLDESQVLLKIPRQNNMYSFDLKNVVPSGGLVRCDNETEFKNSEMNQFCEMKGIKREFSVARTPQQNGVAERKNRTLIEAARTMLADSLLPTTFWAKVINTTCNVQNRVLIRPFGCPVTILNTLDHLGKFERKADKGFLVGYSIYSKAFRVFNSRTRKVEENLHIKFLENKSNVVRSGPEWLFDIDSLKKSMNYEPVTVGNQTNDDKDKDADDEPCNGDKGLDQERTDSGTQDINTAGLSINIASININTGSLNINTVSSNDPSMPSLEETSIFDGAHRCGCRGKRAIGTKWVYRNKKDERGSIVRNKARLVAQEEVYVCQPPGFEDPQFPDKVYKVEKALYGLHQAPKACYMGELTFFLGLQVQQKEDGIFISQDKYVADILKKFNFVTVKTTSTPIETNKALIKDEEAEDVDVHFYRSMIGSLMYLTTSRPDIMFAVCACARDSPFDLEAVSNSDYARANLDRKSTTRGCQFLGKRLISWQCKKQTIVAYSTTEAEYVAVAN
ncbi:retrovirus-related pol polyprotein from transposon TNT 1-94 [Tanacetum coccineum]